MGYEINKTNGETLTIVEDGLVDTSVSSITLIGRNVVNYGEIQNENMFHMLENFAYDSEPPNKIVGQLWFDTSSGKNQLKVYNGTAWQVLSYISYASTSTNATLEGNLWFDSVNKQLYISRGVGQGFDLIGPESATGFGTTKFASATIPDTDNISRPIIKIIVDSEVLGIISKDDFSINPVYAISGFPYIYRGVTFKNGDTSSLKLFGLSEYSTNSVNLRSENGTEYLSASTSSFVSSIVQRDSSGGSTLNKLKVSTIEPNSSFGIIGGAWRVSAGLEPSGDGVYLGNENRRWSTIYSSYGNINELFTQSLYSTTSTSNTANFTDLIDSYGTSIGQFDKDGTLSSNSDAKLATQKALKTYIDAAVQAEVQNRIAAINTVTNRIDNFGYPIPTGTVFYLASLTVPTGYIIADGSFVSKDQYYNLYIALGGEANPYGGVTSTTFKLPDLRGEFIRGWDSGRGLDADRVFASTQNSANLSHNHGMPGDDQLTFANGYAGWTSRSRGGFPYDARSVYGGGGNIWSTTDEGTTESRPRNIALLPVIKY